VPEYARAFEYRLGKGLHPVDALGEDSAEKGRDHFRGDIAEVIAYDRPLSTMEIS
jgi:hypothetical protein